MRDEYDNLSSYKKIRKVWVINPKQRVKPNKKKKNRKQLKKELFDEYKDNITS